MQCTLERGKSAAAIVVAAIAVTLLVGDPEAVAAAGKDGHSQELAAAKTCITQRHKPTEIRLYFPRMNSEKGMRLFASKGCVACHAVNGVGGHGAKNLDAHAMDKLMNPFEFVAKMWRMAPAMIAAQEEVLGEQITFTGEEIAHIIGFVHDDERQHKFTEAMIPPNVRKLMNHVHDRKPAHQGKIGHKKKRKK